ncbi:hotdog fold thioesterase (plasmid) [Deinococcus psychrotolerans]|uniref:Hotdog fold thioesterase n=1 Tax=Deinococcus psychrotolerans TaxID=2489213 RepID=A0A3G8YTP2_9DEIO|nr:hotdog fold thioesterase [Deinococcus psychrotolerans]AZI44616.1 hotdog fold thioesterase [Deinococcus psychrotolerans]
MTQDAFLTEGTLVEHLGITFSEQSGQKVVASMPVEARVHQPFGILHGGASVVLAETVASIGAYLNVRERGMVAVGLEINANHLRSVASGTVTATGTPIFQGRTTEVWHIEIKNEAGKMVCVSRCTLAVIVPPTR